MVLPDYKTIMLPLLRFSGDCNEHSPKEAGVELSKIFNLTDEEKTVPHQSGTSLFNNRVNWAVYYLKNSGLIKSTKRGMFQITEKGLETLRDYPQEIDTKFLKNIHKTTIDSTNLSNENYLEISAGIDKKTPEEIFYESYLAIRKKLIQELLTNLKNSSHRFFENLVVELLVSLGYGGSFSEAGLAIGKSGDEGVDGIIKQDILGLDVIYIQAKKWEGNIGRPEIQKFAGALHGQHSRKGIFITTGTFSSEAKEYVCKIDSKIVLIDGKQLAEYMIDHNIGVTAGKSFYLKKIDTDYFDEDQ